MSTGERIAQKAMSYKGERGGFVWDYWAGLGRGQSWCVGFVLYVLYQCGLKKEIYSPSKVSLPFWLPTIEEWLHEHATHVKMADAQPGDIVIFTWKGCNGEKLSKIGGGNNSRRKNICSRDHIGFIRKKGTSRTAYTIEGNTSGGIVDERTRDLTNIFAIYRLDCCRDKAAVKAEKKAVKAAKKIEKKLAVRKAIDISAWQGNLSVSNFKDVKAAGYDTVIFRCGYTSQSKFDLNKDKVFEHNIQNAHAAGLKIGIYWYSQAITVAEAKAEAKETLNVIKKYKSYITEEVAFDWEFGGRLNSTKARSLGKSRCTNICEAFCEAVRTAGYKAMVYANYSTLTSYLNDSVLKNAYRIWLAHYTAKTSYKGYYLWQYSSKGKVPGISGHVDVNLYASTNTPTPAEKPAKSKDTGFSGPWPTEYVSITHYTHKNAQRWQWFLNWYFKRKVVEDDGIFGNETKKWTKKFQQAVFKSSKEWDGIAGSKTIAAAKKVKR